MSASKTKQKFFGLTFDYIIQAWELCIDNCRDLMDNMLHVTLLDVCLSPLRIGFSFKVVQEGFLVAAVTPGNNWCFPANQHLVSTSCSSIRALEISNYPNQPVSFNRFCSLLAPQFSHTNLLAYYNSGTVVYIHS